MPHSSVFHPSSSIFFRPPFSVLHLPSPPSILYLLSSSLLLLPFVFLLLSGCAPKPSSQLTVGMELAYPPFEMTDDHGAPAGISVDLAHALGEFTEKKVVIENIPFDGLIPSLKTGKIDLIISSMTITPERSKSIDFSDPYLKTGLCLLVGKNSNIQSIQDLSQPGKTIVAKQGTTGHLYARENLKGSQVLVLDLESACVLEVVQGKADAFIYDQMSTYKNWQANPTATRAILSPFKQEEWGMGIRKGNDPLRLKVNEFIRDFREKKGFEILGDRYLKEQKEAFRKLGYPFYF